LKPDLDARLSRVAALGEPVRRALYLGVAHHVAKFHLDRLVAEGLLDADYRRPPGQGGPGAGRPAKIYRRAAVDLEVSVPERRYDFAGLLLARAAADSERTDRPVAQILHAAAHDTGREIGAGAVLEPTVRRRVRRGVDRVLPLLDAYGYAPKVDRDRITLSNCPFHALAQEETELICEMNRNFLDGLLEGVEATDLEAELDPAPGRCCVTIRTA
jgi:predicted ArsR family transcriptional regulator